MMPLELALEILLIGLSLKAPTLWQQTKTDALLSTMPLKLDLKILFVGLSAKALTLRQ
jgi:hypothetical protein